MPLMQGKSKGAFEHNMKSEMNAGKPPKQSLAIAYATKRHAMKKKMAMGGAADTQSIGDKIRYPKGASMAMGGHVHNSMCMSRGGSCYAEGGLARENNETSMDDMDRSRGYDKSVLKENYGESHNEKLDPRDEPEHGVEKEMMKQHRFGYKAQEYEDLPHPMQPKEEHSPDEEDMPHGMMGADAKMITKAIMRKMAMGGKVEGDAMGRGEADRENLGLFEQYPGHDYQTYEDHEETDEGGRSDTMYADGGEVNYPYKDDKIYNRSYGQEGTTDRSMTNIHSGNTEDLDDHPDDDYLSDEEQTAFFHPNDRDEFDPSEKRKMMLSNIMRGLHRARAS
jgi:hypothetical protein